MDTQTLQLADSLFITLRSGRGSVTIRTGKRDVSLGPLVFVGAEDANLMKLVNVISVEHLVFSSIRQRDLEKDGFRDHADALAVMQLFYADLTMESPVTVIRFVPA